MNHTLRITIRHIEGAIIRIIGLVERRGFSIKSVNATPSTCGQEMAMVIEVESERSAETLVRQVEKLFDVRAVSLQVAGGQDVLFRERITC